MPRKQKKYHYIYKTTNILNNKFYIGMHTTDDLEDGYVGSGKRLWYSINKHGKENHKTEVLEYLPDRESLRNREEEIVNEELLSKDSCMNLIVGGNEHCEQFNTPEGIERRRDSINRWMKSAQRGWYEKYHNDEEFRNKHNEHLANALVKRLAMPRSTFQTFLGKKHTQETKDKMSLAKKGKYLGEAHSQYGTCWIYSLQEKKSIKIKLYQLNDYIDNGWVKGRKMNFQSFIDK